MAPYGAADLAVWMAFWRIPEWRSGSADVAVWPQNASDRGDFAFAVAKRSSNGSQHATTTTVQLAIRR